MIGRLARYKRSLCVNRTNNRTLARSGQDLGYRMAMFVCLFIFLIQDLI